MQPSSKATKAPISISLNFDSLSEAYGFPANYRDPSFFQAFDRLVGLTSKHGLRFTIYIIGRDLENPEHFARVREWANAGFEIGNHTWNHYHNLGALPPEKVREEITLAHNRIAECTGKEPRGFISPAWAVSERVLQVLIELGYGYDTSIFPSVLLYPMLAKAAVTHAGVPQRALRILHRRDWSVPLTKPTRPFFMTGDFRTADRGAPESLLVLPLPAMSRFGKAMWHTVGFTLGWKTVFESVEKLLKHHEGFYYLIHPGDFLAPEEQHPTMKHGLFRMNVPLAEKMAALNEVFGIMSRSDRPKATMGGLALYHGACPAD